MYKFGSRKSPILALSPAASDRVGGVSVKRKILLLVSRGSRRLVVTRPPQPPTGGTAHVLGSREGEAHGDEMGGDPPDRLYEGGRHPRLGSGHLGADIIDVDSERNEGARPSHLIKPLDEEDAQLHRSQPGPRSYTTRGHNDRCIHPPNADCTSEAISRERQTKQILVIFVSPRLTSQPIVRDAIECLNEIQ